MINGYELLQAGDPELLSQEVGDRVAEGWLVHGQTYVHSIPVGDGTVVIECFQAVVAPAVLAPTASHDQTR